MGKVKTSRSRKRRRSADPKTAAALAEERRVRKLIKRLGPSDVQVHHILGTNPELRRRLAEKE